jgi:hypothetical protein
MPKALTVQAKLEVRIPTVPNFLDVLVSDSARADFAIDVADLEAADLHNIIKAWGDELIEHALERRKERPLVKATK